MTHRALNPTTGHLRSLLVGSRRRRPKTQFVGKSRRDLLMRFQSPMSHQPTTPLAAGRVLPIVNDEVYFSQLALQPQRAAFALPQGKKPRPTDWRVVGGVLEDAAAPIHGLRPSLRVRCRQAGVWI